MGIGGLPHPTWWYYVFAAESPVNVWCWYLAASVCLCVVSLYLCSGSILWFLLHSLLNYEKWITCIFLVKNDSMTHKTINLSDMCYFQPPILIKITVNPLFQFLMLPDNQTRHGKFTFFKVKLYKKGKNMFPSQAYRPSRPIWIVKTWFKPIFSFNTTILSLSRKNVLLISI